MKISADWIAQAVAIIEAGIARKLEKDNVTVYAIGDTVIRIDIKRRREEEEQE